MFEKEAEEIANKRCHEIMCYGHCSFSSPKHHRCGEWHREYKCALKGAEFGYNKAKVEVEESYRESLCNSELNLTSITEQLEELEKANEWHNLNANYEDLPNEGEWVEGLYLWYYKDEPEWDVFKVRWFYEIGELDEKLVRWYSSDENNPYERDYWNKVDEPDYWRNINLPMRNEYDRKY